MDANAAAAAASASSILNRDYLINPRVCYEVINNQNYVELGYSSLLM